MKLFFKYIIVLLLITQTSCKRTSDLYDENLVTSNTTLDLNTNNRGIRTDQGIIYYVTENKQTILAIKDNKTFWQTNIIDSCGKPYMGDPEISEIILTHDTLSVTYGRHSYATVDAKTGETNFWGQD